jgi:hypothetical protein
MKVSMAQMLVLTVSAVTSVRVVVPELVAAVLVPETVASCFAALQALPASTW